MPNIINNVRAEVSSYAVGLTKLYSKILAIDSPVVDKAIASLSTATKIQEEQISGLNATQIEIDAFVLTVQVTDNRVASCIRELTKMYEAVYNYSHGGSTDIATDSLAEWLYKNWGDRFTYGYALYNSEDLENMSQEEFDKYVEQLLALDYNSLSVEDKTRVQAVLDYLSGVDVDGNMSDSDKSKIRQYVALYEKLKEHENEKEEINKFFDNSVKGGFSENDIFNIKYFAYTSSDPSHTIFFSYIGKCRVSDFNSTNNDGSRGSWYSFVDHSLHLNKDSYGGFDKDPRGAYNTVFHEIGHNIDDLMVDGYDYHENSNGTAYVNTFTWDKLQEGNFFDTLRGDVENNIRNSVNQYSNSELLKIDNDGKEKLVSALLDRRNATWLNPRLKNAYEKIYASYTGKINVLGGYFGVVTEMGIYDAKNGQLDGASNEMISDIYGGVTNNSVVGSYAHEGGQPFKNESSYWYTTDGKPTRYQNLEFFAEYFAMEMTRDSDAENARHYLPQSYKVMDEAMMQKALDLKNNLR